MESGLFRVLLRRFELRASFANEQTQDRQFGDSVAYDCATRCEASSDTECALELIPERLDRISQWSEYSLQRCRD